jgi:dTDP-4-amino-4,6-dideoxygalactose transaminase
VVARVPFVDLEAQEREVAADAVAAIGQVAGEARFILGPRVEAFERWLADACGTEHAVGVASGSDALELALRALGIGAGDAVVTPAVSFIATAEAIVAAGARPVFCDVDAATMNGSEATFEAALARAARGGLRVRALLPVDLFGLCAAFDGLRRLAKDHGLVIVEDAAQAITGRGDGGRLAGSGGDIGCFSFFPTKGLGAWGDGGAIVTSRADLAERVRRLRVHGASSPYVHPELGRNSRLDALQAAVLLAKTPHLSGWQERRARLARRYLRDLAGLPMVLPAEPAAPAVHAWHAFVVRTDRRDALHAWLRDRGVESRVYYPVAIHRQACFAGLDEPSLPQAEALCRTSLALPLFTTMTEEQQGQVVEATCRFFAAVR